MAHSRCSLDNRSRCSELAIARMGTCCCLTSAYVGAAPGAGSKKPTATRPTSLEKSWTTSKADMSWGRVASPLDAVRPGEEVEVKILKYDREKGRISLGRKQLLPDPWASVVERYVVGTKLTGKIMGLTDYGAFVELEPGIEGLVHVSEMSWSKRKQHPSKIVKVGDDVEVSVLGVDSNERRISLGMKQAQSDPWQQLAEKYPVGTVVSGKIRNLTEFGAFLEIEEGFDGLIHVSDISWTGRVKNPADVY